MKIHLYRKTISMKVLLLIFLFVIQGCSSKIIKMKAIKREKIDQGFYYKKPTSLKRETYSKTSWVALIFISNNYSPKDHYHQIEDLCKNSDVISDLEVNTDYLFLPIVFAYSKLTYKGICHD